MEIKWGRYPSIFAFIGSLTGLVFVLALDGFVAKMIAFGALVVFLLLYFMHFVIITDKYLIFCYSLIFVFVKKDDGVLIQANLGKSYCDNYAYYIGDRLARYLFVYGENDRINSRAKKKEQKDDFDYIEYFKKARKNAITMKYSEQKSYTKIGGHPNLPESFVWPEFENKEDILAHIENRPLSFAFQADMREVSKFDTSGLLPKTGVLSVFYDCISYPSGWFNGQENGLKVYYFEQNPEDMAESDFYFEDKEEEMPWLLNEHFLSFGNEEQVPGNEEAEAREGKELPKYDNHPEVIVMYEGGNEYSSQFFGYSRDLQGSTFLGVQDDVDKIDNDYILLLQLESDPDLGENDFLRIGYSRLYIYIKQEDLINKDFSKVRYIMDIG